MTNAAGFPFLSIILFLPLLGAAVLMFVPKENSSAIRLIANLFALAGFLVSVPLWFWYNVQDAGYQFVERMPWIPSVGAQYFLGVDGFSALLVLLATLFGFIAILSSWTAITERVKEYYIFLLILQTGMVGAFVSLDFLLFFLFWEVMLVPMYFLIGIWGSDRRLYSAIKFFLYTLVGSVIMLLGILALYFYSYSVTGVYTFDITQFQNMNVPFNLQWWVFLAFFLGFAVKVPMFPFHTWLPDAHTDAPTAGSVILAAVLLKMGTYGFIRFSLPILPDATRHFVPMMVTLSIIGIVYGALCAMAQQDWKRLVAYSSVSHMAMVMLGMFALNPVGIMGSIVQQLNHGISTGALFLLVGNVYERRHTRQISEYGGLSKVMPTYAVIFLIMTMSSIGLPALNGFIGELLILQGVFVANKIWAGFAASGVVLGAAYMLWLYQRTMFGKIENPKNEHLQDLNFREFATFAPLLILAVWIGLYPKPFIDRLQTSVDRVVVRINPEYRAAKVPGSGSRFRVRLADDPGTGNGERGTAGSPLVPAGINLSDFYYLLPEIVLTTGALVLLLADLMTPRDKQSLLAWVTLAVLGATAVALLPVADANIQVSRGLIAVDRFALFFKVIFLGSAAFTVLMSVKYLDVEGTRAGEYYFLILCATLGMMFMAGGTDLITLFIGLETMAISFYILTGFLKPSRRSNEAAVKYFLLGAFSLGILLYGMSLMYGLSGTTNLRAIATQLAGQESDPRLILAVILVVAGMGFKIAAVPFHMWAPDVYEGAPTPITGFLSVGSKAASFAMLLRIFVESLPTMRAESASSLQSSPTIGWGVMFYILAVVTMTVGNFAALTQSNLKRMLAYSSIAHAGYLLIGVVAGTARGVTAMLVYLFVYAFMQLGAFAVIALMRRADVVGDELKDLNGLFFRQPFAALAMLLFMLSLGGIPPTAGFMGKFWLFSAAIESGYVWLAVIGVLNSAVSLYYYIRIVVYMMLKNEPTGSEPRQSPALAVALGVAVAATLLLGVYPQPLFEFAQASAATLGASAVTQTLP